MAEELYSARNTSACNWFDPTTGIYKSKYKSLNLPKTRFLDVVSFIFSFEHNGNSALIHPSSGYSISYFGLRQMVNSFASGLHHQLGVSKGDVVLILLPNTIYYPIIFLGVLSVGAIAMPMNPLSSFIEIEKRVKDCNVTVVFTESLEKIEHLNEVVRVVRVPLVENIVECELQTCEFACFNTLLLRNPKGWTRPVIDQDDTAAILYSSGTSGASKGVVLTHKNFISVIEVFVRFEALQSNSIYPVLDNVYLALVPMFHVYGLALFSLGLLSLGSTVVVMRNYDIEEMLQTIDKYRVTHLPIVPPILMDLTRADTKGRSLLKSVKQVSFGAAPSSRKLIQDFSQGFPHVDLIQGYGMTESTAVGTRGLNTSVFRKYTSVGLLQPNLEGKVVDLDSGLCLPPGLSGELHLKGPGIMKGYLNDAKETKVAIDENGWLRTGDIVYFDRDGYLYIVDRLKEMIKYKGYQIAPADLESIILSHPNVLDVAVTGCRDEESGEIPVAYVVKKHGSILSEEDVINFVKYRVAPCKKVRKVVFTNCIPKSPAGKILRRQLRNSLVSRI